MSIFETHYPRIEQTRLHIEARIKQLEDKLFSRKIVSEQINHEQLQYNIANLYNMMKETADNQVLLHRQLNHIKNEAAVDSSIEARIHRLELSRRQAEEKAALLQKQLDGYSLRDEKERLVGYELSANKRLKDLELDARIDLYRASLEEDSRRVYQNKMRNILSQQEMQLQQLRRDREAFDRNYRNLSAKELSSNSGNKYETHSFGGDYYGRSFGSGKYQPMTDYKKRYDDLIGNSSQRKQDDRTQPSPQKFRYSEAHDKRQLNLRDDSSPSKKYNYQQASDHYPSFRNPKEEDSNRKQDDQKKSKRQSHNDQNKQPAALNIKDLNPKQKDSSRKPGNSHLIQTRQKLKDSDSDSLQKNKFATKKKLLRSNSYEGSTEKRRSSSKNKSKSKGNHTFYGKYMDVKKTQKSPAKRRSEALNKKDIQKNAFERIQNRIMHAWAVYEDSTFRNVKHEKDHLFNTYKLEMRLRNEIKEKLDSHHIVQKKFGFIVE